MGVLEAIAAGQPLNRVLDLLIQTAEVHCPGMIGSILSLDGGRLRTGIPNRLPTAYNEAIDDLEIGEGAGSCGTAAHRGEIVVVEQISSHPFWTPFAVLAAEAGVEACWSQPIKASTGQVLGTFALYYREPRAPTEDELSCIARAAHLAAIAMTKDRAERDLIRSKESAEAASQAKSVFLAQMSHELRTPLNAIIGFSDMMRTQVLGPLPDRYREYAGHVGDSGEHLLKIINDMLDLAKVEAGEIRLYEEVFNVGAMIAETVALAGPASSEVKATLIADIAPDLPPFYGDELRIKQVLFNLLSNAIKFTDHGSITVTANCIDGCLTILVADTGIGMAAEDIDVALSFFGQVDSQLLTKRHEGTGLGLPLSKELLDLHDAKLDIDSEKGRGTRISIRFPAERTFSQTTEQAQAV
ncbi:MAG: ATP-binding protein [Alphaproteobacteria bacterium]|jgi:signal transduction histidine kinase|nr:ATP-binding protein [Alphaproteobacteria bacterium]MDP6567895.1 ATP-binding protein [Alphaproteobacteria bacterium]MDP6812402.1 ATP-binding protein [Alphaproteobacteria bacterium]